MVKIDTKDRRILDMLDKDPVLPFSRLAKKVGVSLQVADYRIKRLLAQRTIYKFFTLIDPGQLGYALFRVHIRLRNVPEELFSRFAKSLFEDYPTFWVAFVSGTFDIITDIWSQGSNEFEKIFVTILEKNKNIIHSYDIFPILELDLYEYGYFLKERTDRNRVALFRTLPGPVLDEMDKKILRAIKSNARLSYEAIAREVGLTRNAVKYRIKNLEKSKVIAWYKMMVDFRHFDRLTYKIFVKYDSSKIEQENSLLTYLQEKPAILSTTKLLGKWNLDVEFEPKNAKELQQFLIDLRNKFSIINDYEFIQVLQDYGLDFYPAKIQQIHRFKSTLAGKHL